MIPHTERQWQALPWQQELREAFRSSAELFEFLQLSLADSSEALAAAREFPVLVPRPYARRMNACDQMDPLLLQVLPSPSELLNPLGYSEDPLREASKNPVPGLIHKYHGRVLLIAASGCAINCRYCFRRHFDYSANRVSTAQWRQTLAYIGEDKSISEVILSGGDPLLLDDELLATLVAEIEAIPHVHRLRIHSRLPVVIPQRITEGLCTIFGSTRLRCVMVLHCNHGNEIDQGLTSAIARLNSSGIRVLNQSVLLAGINDDYQVLASLGEQLFDAGAMPYYLHLLDKVSGASHFEVPTARALDIYQQLLDHSPGYLVPKLVRESPDHRSKIPLSPYDKD